MPRASPELQSLLAKSRLNDYEISEIQDFVPEKIKIAVIGTGGIGKSALSLQYVQSLFSEGYDPTLQDYYSKKAYLESCRQYVDIEILDTAGQDEFSLLRNEYMKNQDGFLLCFSLNSKNSFDELEKFYKEIYRSFVPAGEAGNLHAQPHVKSSNSRTANANHNHGHHGHAANVSNVSSSSPAFGPVARPIYLIATKCDIPPDRWQVSDNDISQKMHKLYLNLERIPIDNGKNCSDVTYTNKRFLQTSAKMAVNVDRAFEKLAEEILEHKRIEYARTFKSEKKRLRRRKRWRRMTCGLWP